jgi:hypothetical protein
MCISKALTEIEKDFHRLRRKLWQLYEQLKD